MEQTPIVIVGAGPAGLVLGLSLASFKIKSVILEKEVDIAKDPRGVYLAGEAVRILGSLGIDKYFAKIGHVLKTVQFHSSNFQNQPFHFVDLSGDPLKQALPTGILQIQPELESALRAEVTRSQFCDLRCGCAVNAIEAKEATEPGVIVTYTQDGSAKQIAASWLVGADGKRGIVRKGFLEETAGIRQVNSSYRYDGTWVAANLSISLPQPDTHPDLAIWKHGMTGQQMYDLFWPKGWHFCRPPGSATASGRFGPHESRIWRHEFSLTDWNDDTMDAEALFWDHITPMITRSHDATGVPFAGGPIVYPRDCIQILRCRPFTFTHKVVNRWFADRTILIGDAAHVFPPFGGQGIASGIRDAHQLAWRLAVLTSHENVDRDFAEDFLSAWVAERTKSVEDAALITRLNGTLCESSSFFLSPAMWMMRWSAALINFDTTTVDPQAMIEGKGFKGVAGGWFLNNYNGGSRLPQIYVDSVKGTTHLSDAIFTSEDSPLRLIMFCNGPTDRVTPLQKVRDAISSSKVPAEILSPASIILLGTAPSQPASLGNPGDDISRKWAPTELRRLEHNQARKSYSPMAFIRRLGANARFAIVRPDFYVFAVATDYTQLQDCLDQLRRKLRL